jgi:lipopolysaccharide exporter
MTPGGPSAPLPGADEARAEVHVGPAPSFWRTRAWWRRAGRTAMAVYVATVLAFVATVVVARELGPAEFGTIVLAVGVATLFATFLDLTLEEAVIHHGYRALADGDAAGVLGLIRASLLLDIGIGLVVSGIVAVLAVPLADLASAGRLDPDLVRLAALVTLASTADSTMSAVLQVAGRPDLRGWAMAGTNLARLTGVLIALQLGAAQAVILAYAVGNAVGAAGQALVAWRLARRRWGAGAGTLRVPIRELVRFGFQTSVTTSVTAAYGALIPVVLGRVGGSTAVGLFRVALFPVLLVDAASGPIRLVLLPEQARLSAEGDIEQLRGSIRAHVLAALAVGLPFVAAAWFALPWLLPFIFSAQFEDAILPARILLIVALVHLVGAWFKTLPAAIGKPQLRTALSAFELVLMLTLLVVLGDNGAEGAAIALSVSAVAASVLAFASVDVLLRSQRAALRSRAGAP